MFSLIITIISIALVAALALATLYFGGDAFNQGSARASAATLVNQAQQISGANTLHFVDVQSYATASDLVNHTNQYLASVPNPGNNADDYVVDTATGEITATGVSAAVCAALNVQSGSGIEGAASSLSQLDDVQFGCYEDGGDGEGGGAGMTFIFK